MPTSASAPHSHDTTATPRNPIRQNAGPILARAGFKRVLTPLASGTPNGCLNEVLLQLLALTSTPEGQQQNPKRNPQWACERDKRTCCDFDKQVVVGLQ